MDLSPDQTPVAADAMRITPMMEQYIEIKAANPGVLLFYRMGDFYELFFGDAEIAARCLGIVLTRRGRHQGEDVPMCGVPVVRAEEYLHRLIAAGHRVAVCEQAEDPAEARKRGGKSVVRREVVRLVTPGTLTEEGLLEPARANRLLAVARLRTGEDGAVIGLAYADISTGEFGVAQCAPARLAAEIARLDPAEIVLSEALYGDPDLADLWRGLPVTPLGADLFDGTQADRRLAAYFEAATVDGFGSGFSRVELTAAAALTGYIERTQVGQRPSLAPPRRETGQGPMAIDAATRANLELTRTLGGERRGSLLDTVDRTLTAGGGRRLAAWLASPLTDLTGIRGRQEAVALLRADRGLAGDLRACLKRSPDIARALGRLTLERGGPRDLACLREGLDAMAALAGRLGAGVELPALIAEAAAALAAPDAALAPRLRAALADTLPLVRRDGGFVAPTFDPDLDEARALRDESRRVIAELQARYAEETGQRALKIKHNSVLGYFVELPQAAGEALLREGPASGFIHRQSMAGCLRFSTAELSDLQSRILSAADRALTAELRIFDALAAAILADTTAIRAADEALALLDTLAALATLADEGDWVRPEVEDSLAFAIEGGRHPVVEAALKASGQPFIANGCDLSGAAGTRGGGRIVLLTGPNMAGKSTYLRQNALIAILAQMGSCVPAASATIGLVDALYSRVGAADDLARGRSTFMVEMVETAAILNGAGFRALVILDEIGRGTATYDGLSIAWATVERLHEVNRCRAVFATHYHELTGLAKALPRLANATMRVAEWEGDVVFLHEVAAGAAIRSYGLQVAKLAGMPTAVVARARTILDALEAGDRQRPRGKSIGGQLVEDLPLFAHTAAPPAPPAPDEVAALLDTLRPDELTPRQALDALYGLKARREVLRTTER